MDKGEVWLRRKISTWKLEINMGKNFEKKQKNFWGFKMWNFDSTDILYNFFIYRS